MHSIQLHTTLCYHLQKPNSLKYSFIRFKFGKNLGNTTFFSRIEELPKHDQKLILPLQKCSTIKIREIVFE